MILSAAVFTAACNRNISNAGTDPAEIPVTVFEYTPAPGQFINELPAFNGVETPEAARKFAEKRIAKGFAVSLGGFGGYIIVGFGKSVENSGGYDFSVTGNQHANSSEPGVVWVMQDLNGNGEPDDDAWYELRGSETGKAGTIQGYEVTYFRPDEDYADVPWVDNRGGNGVVARTRDKKGNLLRHFQPGYYPAWVEDEKIYAGTLLESRSMDQSTPKEEDDEYWVNGAYDWGYADNFGSDNIDPANPRKICFKISNAIDAQGESVYLASIDFIKVQTAVNANAGWLGEISTEVTGFSLL